MEELNLKNENNKGLLEEIFQILKVLIYSTNSVYEKTCNENLKNDLLKLKHEFTEFKVECETLSRTIDFSLQTSWLKKLKKSIALNFNLLFEEETHKLTKYLIVNYTSNIVELIIYLDNYPNAIDEIKEVAIQLIKKVEKNIENLKKYLVKNPSNFNKKPVSAKQNTSKSKKAQTKRKSESKK